MRVQIDLSVSQRGHEFSIAVRGAAFGQLVGKILGMVGSHPGGRTKLHTAKSNAI